MIHPKDFEQIDMGMYECECTAVIWDNRTYVCITCWEEYADYGYNDQAVTQCANQSNKCLYWIEEHKEYIQRVIAENSMLQQECGLEAAGRNIRKIEIEVDVQNEIPQETLACLYIDAKPFFSGHCHCVEVAILAHEDGTYAVNVIEDMQRLLLEIREASKENYVEAYEWAGKNGIFYAFDEEGNMLAVVRRQFCLSIDNKLILETSDDNMRRETEAPFILSGQIRKWKDIIQARGKGFRCLLDSSQKNWSVRKACSRSRPHQGMRLSQELFMS